MWFIRGPADLEYVNQQLEQHNSQLSSVELGKCKEKQVEPTCKSQGAEKSSRNRMAPSMASINGIDLRLISPNSCEPCLSRCGVKEPHNLGKFFRDGVRPEREPEDWEYETSKGGRRAPVSHFFNFTVPPKDIVEAYLRMTEETASFADINLVRDYQSKSFQAYSSV